MGGNAGKGGKGGKNGYKGKFIHNLEFLNKNNTIDELEYCDKNKNYSCYGIDGCSGLPGIGGVYKSFFPQYYNETKSNLKNTTYFHQVFENSLNLNARNGTKEDSYNDFQIRNPKKIGINLNKILEIVKKYKLKLESNKKFIQSSFLKNLYDRIEYSPSSLKK